MSDQKVGLKIKTLRESKSISLEEVAERAGLSKTEVELIESQKNMPSLSPLIKIARALGVRLGTFLDDSTALGPVITRKAEVTGKNSLRFAGNRAASSTNMEYFSLSQDKSSRHMEPFLIDLAADASGAKHDLSSHEGEEFIYVLEGAIEIDYGKNTYLLEEGDSIYYDSIVAHNVHTCDCGKARILGVVYTPL